MSAKLIERRQQTRQISFWVLVVMVIGSCLMAPMSSKGEAQPEPKSRLQELSPEQRARRGTILYYISWFGGTAAVASLVLAVLFRRHWDRQKKEKKEVKKVWGYTLLAAWLLIPPVNFWLDWWMWGHYMSHDEQEYLSHLYELSRNIWVALVIVLAAIMDVKWAKGE